MKGFRVYRQALSDCCRCTNVPPTAVIRIGNHTMYYGGRTIGKSEPSSPRGSGNSNHGRLLPSRPISPSLNPGRALFRSRTRRRSSLRRVSAGAEPLSGLVGSKPRVAKSPRRRGTTGSRGKRPRPPEERGQCGNRPSYSEGRSRPDQPTSAAIRPGTPPPSRRSRASPSFPVLSRIAHRPSHIGAT